MHAFCFPKRLTLFQGEILQDNMPLQYTKNFLWVLYVVGQAILSAKLMEWWLLLVAHISLLTLSASNLDFWYKYSITQSMEVMLQELELTPSSTMPRGQDGRRK